MLRSDLDQLMHRSASEVLTSRAFSCESLEELASPKEASSS